MAIRVEYSLSLNNRLAFACPEYGFSGLLALAARSDDSPFQVVWVGDSLFDSPRFEPITTLAAVAMRTRRVRLGTSILQPHFRNPLLLALSWATLDHVSGGRTILGLGIGGGTPEGVAHECREVGINPGQRGGILESCVEEVRALWAGQHMRINLPVRPLQTSIPIWIAAGIYLPGSPKASAQPGVESGEREHYLRGPLGRVARLSNGWFTIMATPQEIRESRAVLDEAARRCGRDPQSIPSAVECWINVGQDPHRCFEDLRAVISRYFDGAPVSDDTVRRWSIWGPPEMCRERLHEFAEAGVQHIKLVIGASDPFPQFDSVLQVIS